MDLVSHFGVPTQIVSDNGPQFISKKFHTFCLRFGIEHMRVSPYHPCSGKAEHFVRTVKCIMGDKHISFKILLYQIHQFLLAYCNALHTTTGVFFTQLMFGKRRRMPLDGLLTYASRGKN